VVSPPPIGGEYVRSDQRIAVVLVEGVVDELRARASSALSFASQVPGEVTVHEVDTAMKSSLSSSLKPIFDFSIHAWPCARECAVRRNHGGTGGMA
jgi:hypothetical protein